MRFASPNFGGVSLLLPSPPTSQNLSPTHPNRLLHLSHTLCFTWALSEPVTSCVLSSPDHSMYKSQLQQYAQRACLTPPVYNFEKVGPSHEPQFKGTVILEGVTYESPPGFTKLKKAENAAAQAALEAVAKTSLENKAFPGPVFESGLSKNRLQAYAQKCNLPLPVYRVEKSGEMHAPVFSSTVEIGGVLYRGGTAKSKKEAEIKAVKTALLAIQSDLRTTAAALEATDACVNRVNSDHVSSSSKKRNRHRRSTSEDAQSKNKMKQES